MIILNKSICWASVLKISLLLRILYSVGHCCQYITLDVNSLSQLIYVVDPEETDDGSWDAAYLTNQPWFLFLCSGTCFSCLNGLSCMRPFPLTCFVFTFLLPSLFCSQSCRWFAIFRVQTQVLAWCTCITSFISPPYTTLLLQSCSYSSRWWLFYLRLWKPFLTLFHGIPSTSLPSSHFP